MLRTQLILSLQLKYMLMMWLQPQDFYLEYINFRLKMSEHCRNCKEKRSLFTDLLKARKMKMKGEKKVIDRVHNKIKPIPELNPQRRFRLQQLSNNSPQRYSDSEKSIKNEEIQIQVPRRSTAKYSSLQEQENILNQRARQFISRLRKQREQNEGKLMMMRKRQEERKELQDQIRNIQRKSLDLVHKKFRINRMMDNIIFHEGRISERAINSLKKEIRSKTQNIDRDELSQSLNINNDSKIYALKRRVKELSDLIDSCR